MRCRAVVLCISGLLMWMSAPRVAYATPSSVAINEALYDAVSTDTGREWIEFFNRGSAAADLTGWRIERGGTAFVSVFIFPAGAAIAPGAFLTVGESLVPDVDFVATLAFENGGSATDGIRLVDNAGVVVDVLLYDEPNTNLLPDESGSAGTSFAPDVTEGHSLARVPDGTDTNQNAVDIVDALIPTPGSSNVLPTPTPSPTPTPTATPTPTPTPRPAPTGVVVSEALPNPVGSDSAGEFLELFNPSSGAVDLSGSRLDDADGGSTPYTIPDGTSIQSGGYLSFSRSETGLALNNEGDRARLLAADGSLVSEVVFEASPAEGAAWARRTDGSADWTATPTAGSANVFTPLPTAEPEGDRSLSSPTPTPRTSPTPTPRDAARAVSLAEARALPRGTRVRVSGVVSAPPNILGRGVFYLAGSGLQVFASGGDPLGLALGDRVTVTGTMSSIRNELRIRAVAVDVQRIGAGAPPESRSVATGSLGESLEGTLVRVHGTISRLSGNIFEVDDGSGAARVLIKKTTGWTRPPLVRGAEVSVIGIVSQSDARYRILPRFPGDVTGGGIVAGAVTQRPVVVAGDERLSRGIGRAQPRAAAPSTLERTQTVQELEGLPATEEPETVASSPSNGSNARLPLPTLLTWSAAGILGVFRVVLRPPVA